MMVVAEQVQRAVDQQMRRMVLDGNAFSAASASQTPRARMMSPSNSSGRGNICVAASSSASRHREGEDVGRLVLAAPFGVQRADLVVARSGGPTSRPGASDVGELRERRFRRSPLRRRCGPAAPRSGYCPIPHRLRGRFRASSRPGPFIGLDDPPDERVADDVGGGEADRPQCP